MVDRKLILHLEKLAKLSLSEEERFILTKDLSKMIEMVDQLKEVNTEGIEPLIHMNPNLNFWRSDEVKSNGDTSSALKNAPTSSGKFYSVPKMIKK